MAENTLPKLLKKNAEKYGDRRIAMRVKDRGHLAEVYLEGLL